MKIYTVLPVSRTNLLARVLDSLMNQTHKPENLIVVYDGPKDKFVEVRNKVAELELSSSLCVQSNNTKQALSIPDRRRHIANIHNQIRGLIGDADWIFSIEDDGILPPNALERLINVVNAHDNVGMVTGVELGRWGVPYVGAWVVDDIDNIQIISSIENKTLQTPFTVEEIDACGLYCALIKADCYKQHDFFADNGLGADVNLGISIRKQGFKNYIDWGIPLTHITDKNGIEIEIPATNTACTVKLRFISGSIWYASH